MIFNVGDSIVVVTPGAVYSSFDTLAKSLGAENWVFGRGRDSGHLKTGMTGIITKLGCDNIYLVRLEDGYDYLMAGRGIAHSETVFCKPSKYSNVINKIKEMKTRREKLGYKY